MDNIKLISILIIGVSKEQKGKDGKLYLIEVWLKTSQTRR